MKAHTALRYLKIFSFGFILLQLYGCSRIPVVSRYTTPKKVSEKAVWAQVKKESKKHALDPHFVYSLVCAESGLNPHARSKSDARGMMQLKKIAWVTVTDESFAKAWNWKANIRVGTAYLGFCKRFMKKHGHFSYPLLAASYLHGPNAVKRKGFKINRMPRPSNKIYAKLFTGHNRAVKTP